MDPVFRGQWRNLLRMDHGPELGPNPNDVNEDSFLRNCLRCGRQAHIVQGWYRLGIERTRAVLDPALEPDPLPDLGRASVMAPVPALIFK